MAGFAQILARLDDWPAAELHAALAQADAALQRWPDEHRCAGEQLLVEGPDGAAVGVKPSAVLVRRLEFEPSHAGCEPWLIELIARAPELRNLTILNLPCEDVESVGAEAIANSSTLRKLKQLRLGADIDDGGLCAIAQSTGFAELELLELRGWISDDETAEILANSPHMAKLVALELEDDGLGDDGFWALGMSRFIPADIRASYLAVLDGPTLLGKAREAEIECPIGASESALIEHLVRTSISDRAPDGERR